MYIQHFHLPTYTCLEEGNSDEPLHNCKGSNPLQQLPDHSKCTLLVLNTAFLTIFITLWFLIFFSRLSMQEYPTFTVCLDVYVAMDVVDDLLGLSKAKAE